MLVPLGRTSVIELCLSVLSLGVGVQDWLDIDFGISEAVDFIAISFVRSPDVLTQLRSYIKARSPSRYGGIPCACT